MKRDLLAVLSAFVLFLASPAARAWDELGPLAEARRAHPAFFAKGAVHRTEVDGAEHWVFTGDSDLRDGFEGLSDTERYAEAALDARRNLLRHVTGGSRNATAEVSGIVVAYRFADGTARRVVCLVPVENIRVVSAVPAPKPAIPEASETPAAPAAPAAPAPAPEPAAPAASVAPAPAPAPEPAAPADPAAESVSATPDRPVPERSATPSHADPDLPRFSPPALAVPTLPVSPAGG